VAFEASAEERDTRGFISMTTTSAVSRFSANWTFEPPVSTPTARITAAAASRRTWNSMSERVIDGATQTESPVCTPIGSMFSIEQTITTLSRLSRITSSSNSPQPSTDSSTRTWPIGLSRTPRATTSSKLCASRAKPPPWPPRVNAGRITTGRLSPSSRATRASSTLWAITERGTRRPTEAIASPNASRSSAVWMAFADAPISSMPSSSRMPSSLSRMARLSAVWPPSVGSSASGRSRRRTSATPCRSSGSR
jgi:hypothetical protein